MERDLFGPIKAYFEKQGYVCDGEVGDIDLYMERGDETAAVELKVTLDFKAVQQAALRQKITDTVYIGIFKPKDMRSSSFRDKVYLLKRLGIGLLVVSKRSKLVEVASEPVVSELSSYKIRNKGKKNAVSKEFHERKTKLNVGGVTGEKLITSYREKALLVLDACVELGGEASTKDIRELSGVENATTIMYHNHYGWFENTAKGKYRVRDVGYAAFEEFEDVLYAMKKNGGAATSDK